MLHLCEHWCWYGLFFFFKQKTAYEMRISDWSSDVCSSDLFRDLGCIEPMFAEARNQAERLAAPTVGHRRLIFRLQRKQLVGTDGEQQIGRASCRERVCQYV